MNRVHTSITRLLALALVATAALALAGCADGPGNGSGGTSSGCTTDCVAIPVTCPKTGQTFTAFSFADAKVTTVPSSSACVGCSIDDAVDVIDEVTDNYAIMSLPVGATGSNSLTVTDTQMSFPAGSEPGFIVSTPSAPVLTLNLLQTVTVTAENNGTDTESAAVDPTPGVGLSLLGTSVSGNPALQFVSLDSTKPYNAVRLDFGGSVNTLSQLHVYGAGICE